MCPFNPLNQSPYHHTPLKPPPPPPLSVALILHCSTSERTREVALKLEGENKQGAFLKVPLGEGLFGFQCFATATSAVFSLQLVCCGFFFLNKKK